MILSTFSPPACWLVRGYRQVGPGFVGDRHPCWAARDRDQALVASARHCGAIRAASNETRVISSGGLLRRAMGALLRLPGSTPGWGGQQASAEPLSIVRP